MVVQEPIMITKQVQTKLTLLAVEVVMKIVSIVLNHLLVVLAV